uniref:Ferredoxin-like protein n=1 Tax=Aegilops tauschii TaxID=37682 RepID=M8AZ81_AEGTA
MAVAAQPLLASALLALLLAAVSAADTKKDNPADELVSLINSNRTASKASNLVDNQGLGCIALQYIKAYEGQCDQVGGNKKPVDSSFIDTFAPNCGVQAASLAKITGRLLACQPSYPPPAQAFDMLIANERSLQVLHSKNHTEVGAAVTGTSGGGPYFWCVLFSNGKPNSSFTVEGGVPKTAHPGCFSGNNDECSGAISTGVSAWTLVSATLFALAGAFTL